MSVRNQVFRVAWKIALGTSLPALKRQSSLISEAYDVAFYVHVQRLGERCRTAEDWERLLALLLGISLDPSMDTTPVWAFELAPNPAAAHGLRAASPSTRGRLSDARAHMPPPSATAAAAGCTRESVTTRTWRARLNGGRGARGCKS